MGGGSDMNGTLTNWLKHAALALIIMTGWGIVFGLPAGAAIASVWFWAKEAGEKSKDWDAPRRPWSDLNPFDPRWSRDDRLDLAFPVAAVWLVAITFA